MSHEHYEEQISAMVDNELGEGSLSELFTHLAECSACREFFQSSLRLRAGMIAGAEVRIPATLDEHIQQGSFKKPRFASGVISRFWESRISFPLPAAASLAFLLILGSLLISPALFTKPQPQPEIPTELLSKVPPALRQSLAPYR